jgi:hypothetical protein
LELALDLEWELESEWVEALESELESEWVEELELELGEAGEGPKLWL